MEPIKNNLSKSQLSSNVTPLFNEKDVFEVIRNLNQYKAPGKNEVCPAMCKLGGKTLSSLLLFYLLFSTRWISLRLERKHHRSHTQKNGDSDISNLRPIALLPSIGKTMETLVFKYLQYNESFISNIPQNQFGFYKGRSSTQATTLFHAEAFAAIGRGKTCIGRFMDLSKSYDMVNRQKLLDMIHSLHLTKSINVFLSHFLGNRKGRIRRG